jgi:hypothetical protein
MRYCHRLENDLSNFFDEHFEDINLRIEASKAFDLAVCRCASALLNEEYHPTELAGLIDNQISDGELFELDAAMALQTIKLFVRALVAKSGAHITEKRRITKTNRQKVLRENITAKLKSNPGFAYASRIGRMI